MIADSIIAHAVKLLHQNAPGATIILFGSYARGEAKDDSDLDLLIVEPELRFRRRETMRLRDLLRPLRLPVDLIVVSRSVFDAYSGVEGSILQRAQMEGRVLRAAS